MPTTIDLGFPVPDYRALGSAAKATAPEPPPDDPPTKTAYPSMTILGNAGLAKALQPGQTVTATVTFRVSEICVRERDDDDDDPSGYYGLGGGTRVELEAQSMTFDNLKVDESADEPDASSAFKKFMSKKAMAGKDE